MREINLLLIPFGRLVATLPSTLFIPTNQVRSRYLVLGTTLNTLGIIYCMVGFDVLCNWYVYNS